MAHSSPCGGESRGKVRTTSGKTRELQEIRTVKITALSRLKIGAGRVDTFIVLEMASGIRAGEGESFLVFMADERDGFEQRQVERGSRR